MYKVLIVDDEVSILEGMQYIINWDELGLEIKGLCSNAADALELLGKTRINLLITDIKMPVMTGLELLKKVKSMYPSIKCIVLSGYDDFEFIKEAMLSGIENYLLKPISEEELASTLKNSISKIESELKRNIEFRQGMHALKDNILYRCATGEIGKDEFDERASVLGLEIGSSNFAVAILKVVSEPLAPSSGKIEDKKLLRFAIQNICEEVLAENLPALTFCDLNGDLVFVFSSSSAPIASRLVQDALQKCIQNINRFLVTDVFITVGKPEEYFEMIHTSYEDAKKLQDYQLIMPPNSLVFYNAITKLEDESKLHLNIDFKKLQEYITRNDMSSAIHFIESIYIHLKEETRVDPVLIRNISLEALLYIKLAFNKCSFDSDLFLEEFKDAFSSTLTINSIEKLQKWLTDIIQKAFGLMEDNNTEVSPIIKKVIEYIETNYMRDINLKTIAAEHKINPVYLGYLFKKETGDIFTNYLNSVRIEAAKRFLSRPRSKVGDVASKVGYTNASYFNSIFKKLAGLSPTDFKRGIS